MLEAPQVFHMYKKWGDKLLSKTPLWVLDYALQSLKSRPSFVLGSNDNEVCSTEVTNRLALASDEAFFIVGRLNNFSTDNSKVMDRPSSRTRIEMAEVIDSKDELQGETVILYIPSCAVFYTIFADNGVRDHKYKSFSPLPAEWLRIKRDNGQCAKGGFLESFSEVIPIVRREKPSTEYYAAHHSTIYDIRIVPDYLIRGWGEGNQQEGLRFWRSASTTVQRRIELKKMLQRSPTMRTNCKQTVRGLIYSQSIFSDKVLRISTMKMPPGSERNIRVVAHHLNMNQVHTESTLRIRKVDFKSYPGFPLLLGEFQHRLLRSKQGGCRKTDGQLGYMIPLGQHIHQKNLCNYQRTEDMAMDDLLCNFMKAYRVIMATEFPFELATAQNIARRFGLDPPDVMGGAGGTTSSITVSVDLANPPHFDMNDLNVSISLWTELYPNLVTNWFFVLPNLFGNHNGKEFNGVIVELGHGVAISWDGTKIKHCTSLANLGKSKTGKNNHGFGIFMGNQCSTLNRILGMDLGETVHGSAKVGARPNENEHHTKT